jgi:hypothetical protein
MKVEIAPRVFRPIKITLDTEIEYEWLYSALTSVLHDSGLRAEGPQYQFYCKLQDSMNLAAAETK